MDNSKFVPSVRMFFWGAVLHSSHVAVAGMDGEPPRPTGMWHATSSASTFRSSTNNLCFPACLMPSNHTIGTQDVGQSDETGHSSRSHNPIVRFYAAQGPLQELLIQGVVFVDSQDEIANYELALNRSSSFKIKLAQVLASSLVSFDCW